MSVSKYRQQRHTSSRNRKHFYKERRVCKYDNIERKLRGDRKPVIVSKPTIAHAIHELKYPSNPRLKPLSDSQIYQDLDDLGIPFIRF